MSIDLEKTKGVLRALDIEGYIEHHGAPPDEYDDEALKIYQAIVTGNASSPDQVIAIVKDVLAVCFNLDEQDLLKRAALLNEAAKRIVG